MNPVIVNKRAEMGELCRRFRVCRLELFGSAATDAYDPQTSDVDFLVEFLPLNPGEHFDIYFGLLEALESLFQRPVDLVVARAIRNPYFLKSVNRTRELVYAA